MMLRNLQRIAGVLIALQGAGHTFLGTPTFFDAVSQHAIWFAGAGLGMIFLGLLNLAPVTGYPTWLRWGIVLGNFAWLVLMMALVSTSQSVRTVLAMVFTAGCAVGSIGSVAGRRL